MKTRVYFQVTADAVGMFSGSFEAVARSIMARVLQVDAGARFVAAKHFGQHMLVIAEVSTEKRAQVAGVHIALPSYLRGVCNCFADCDPPPERAWERILRWLSSACDEDYKAPAQIEFAGASQHKWLSF